MRSGVNNEQMRFAVFCWTHRGSGRERITQATSLEDAIAQSETIRTQYAAAIEHIRFHRGVLANVFLYEEKAHYPSPQAAFAVRRALRWCRENNAFLLVCDMQVFRKRRFAHYESYLNEESGSLKRVLKECILPQEDISNLRIHFSDCHETERGERIAKKRVAGYHRAVASGAKPGFLGNWEGKSEAGEKGRKAQQVRALSRAEPIIKFVWETTSECPGYGFSEIAMCLNEMAEEDPCYKPARSGAWTGNSIRVFYNRYCSRISVQPHSV